jgi:beta-lactamase class A
MNIQEKRYSNFLNGFKNIREESDKYSFINPLVGGISPPATDVGIFSEIKEEVFSYLEKEERAGNLYDYSFYFRDFNTGLWFGSNESADFFPASLFKLPIAIAAYKQAEEENSFLGKQVIYTEEIANINDSIKTNSESILVVGRVYTIEDLIKIMIVESDNGAKNLLLNTIDKKYLNQLFNVVSLVDTESSAYKISSRKYALFLRVLYGSSYLNEDHSETLLKLLTSTTFKKGLVAGVPSNVQIAHKYGTYNFEEEVNGVLRSAYQLHDCGIVYHAKTPYAFCLMTKGKDLDSLYRVISTISEKIYKNQEAENKE